jgi:alpha/beta superfamily hydrolase
MQNKVVHTLARAFELAGARTVRFNFRGVGRSEGEFGDSAGETEDALAVLEWARERRPGDELWLAGFSFGAAVALRAAARFPVARLITVAPAVHLYPDLAALEPPAIPWLLAMGTADEVVPVDAVQEWARSRRHPPTLALHEGVGHYYHQRLPELRDTVLRHLA